MTVGTMLASDRRRSLAAAIACTSAVGMTMGLIWPLLSLILDARGVDGQIIGFSSAAQSLAVLVLSPVAPRLIGGLGLRRAAGGCILVILTALAALRLFDDVDAWFAIRFVLGAAVTILFIWTQTWVSRMAPAPVRGRIIGVFGFLWSAGYAMGPLIIRLAGTAGWPPFLAAMALVSLAGLPLLAVVAPEGSVERAGFVGFGAPLRLAAAAVAAALFLGVVDSAGASFLPLFGLRNGLDQADAVTMLVAQEIGILAVQLPAGWAADRVHARRLLLLLTALALLVCLFLPALVDAGLLLWPGLFLLGIATGGVWTVSLALMGRIFDGRNLASGMALRSLVYGLGSIAGPPAGGLALSLSSRAGLPWLLAGVSAMFLLLQLVLLAPRRRPVG